MTPKICQTSKCLKILWPGVSEKFSFAVYVLISSFHRKKAIFLAEIYFIFLENVMHQTSNAFNTKSGPQWKDQKSSSQVKQIFPLFYKLVALILG